MRIRSIHIPRFKNLNNFYLELDSKAPVSVLVGRNGTGKSNLLEALTIIFRDLDLAMPPSFDYELDYEIRGRQVTVSAMSRDGVIRPRCEVDGVTVPWTRFAGENGHELRPNHVFGYYSGPSNRLEEHFSTHQDRFYKALIRGSERPLRPLFYARNVHSNFVLLSFFIEEDIAIKQLLETHLGIDGLDSALFVMRKPSWTSKSGDQRFWNARGTVQDLLDRLFALSLAPLRLDVRVPVAMRRAAKVEQLFLFLPGLEQVRQLAAGYGSNQDFFKALESTYISDLIDDVRIRVFSTRSDTPLTFRELSEGEQQLLLVLGLMRFTREDESLFLLDEPDTHLNPAWSVQYRRFLEEYGGVDEACHVLMATHDPLVVAGLRKSEVRILERQSDGTILALEPLDDPRGMGVGNLLTSDVYGLRSQLDLETLEKLDRKRLLASKDSLTSEEADDLARLSMDLRNLGLLTEDRDPEFQEYLKAKARIQSREDRIVLSREEIEQNRETAEELVRDILESVSDDGRDGLEL